MESSLIARLERAVQRLEALGVEPSSSSAPAGDTNAPGAQAKSSESSSLTEWDRLLAEHLTPLKILSQHIPQEAQRSMESFENAFQATRRVLEVSLLAKKPDSPAELQSLLAPVSEAMGAVMTAAEGGGSCPNHLKVLSEAVGALGFLACGPGSGITSSRQHVLDCWQSAEFFATKLLMEFRGKDEDQVAWVRGLKALVQQQLEQYVLRNCPTGLRFNPDGVPLAAAMSSVAAVTASAPSAPASAPVAVAPKPACGRPGAPPPPPPGPPPKPLSADELRVEGGGGGGGGMSAIFKELSTGEGITSKLRHVTSQMKSKHNSDRTGCVPSAPSAPPTATVVKKGQPSGPPSLALKGTKWMVENFSGRQDLVVENTTPKQSVYVYGCTDCVVQIQGKVNAISLDNCKRLGVVFSDVIASVEAVNCSSIQVQTTGTVPTVTVEKTDGAQLYLSQACAANPNFQIVSAKSSSINVIIVPAENDPSDPLEQPIPEQYISTFQGGKLVTVAAEHSGA
ncbi:hypothetical protein Vretimale_17943 [Volvox reticuliferus]|uniref:Adenylyl cyclase-associated protein n=1 Tax=Volvox reticuliferus TaxID=1737510 RepID=A0A8J4CU93_9CHLO|nr:hypothetical protein Vretifemale_17665 [Volvox reticuliferus]GIM15135.1 hypothetical protein Vretimale_17943 [Volvox reticuliferus]